MVKLLFTTLVVGLLVLCDDPGTTKVLLNGTEEALPPELKGLKVYRVTTDSSDSYIDIAVLSVGGSYTTGKSTVLVDNSGWDKKEIEIKKIIMENDSIIIALK